jgi:hypothetical protein
MSENNENQTLEYNFIEEDFIECLEFVKKYHLEPTKGTRDRTSSALRGFGGEMDDFISGKLAEIATKRILEKFNKNKKIFIDQNIYTNKEIVEKADPDIVEIEENGEKKLPKLYVEIKKDFTNWGWIGMPIPQLDAIKKRRGEETFKTMFIVHPLIFFSDNKNSKEQNILGALLKRLISSNKIHFNEFSELEDLKCTIECCYSMNDLFEYGKLFKEGNIIPVEEFKPAVSLYNALNPKTKIRNIRLGYRLIEKFSGKKKIDIKIRELEDIPFYGSFEIEGKFEIFEKTLYKTKHIYCLEDTTIMNDVFGIQTLEKNKSYNIFFINKQGNPNHKKNLKNKDDQWILRKRLDELIKGEKVKSTKESIKYIADNI